MKKVLILVLGLSLTAASCNLLGSSGPRGVLKTNDGGETYEAANALAKKGDISGLDVNDLVVHPLDTQILYLGSGNGIHQSVDGAKTWTYILSNMKIADIAIDPSDPDIVYAVGVSGSNGKIIKTSDAGKSWKEIYSEPTTNNPVLSFGISLANSRIVLAGLNNGEVIRSTDEGATWQLVKDIGHPVVKIEYVENTVAYALSKSGGLYKTADQGSNWTGIDVSLNAESNSALRPSISRTYYDVAFDQRLSGVILLATEQGLLRTIDSGATWSVMALPVTNQTLRVSAAAINPTNSNNIVIAVGSTIFKTTNGGVTWETKKLATEQKVARIVFDRSEPNVIYLGMGE